MSYRKESEKLSCKCVLTDSETIDYSRKSALATSTKMRAENALKTFAAQKKS